MLIGMLSRQATAQPVHLWFLYSYAHQSLSKFNVDRTIHLTLRPYRRASAGSRVAFEGNMLAMLDTVMIVLGVGFFVASILYVLACERM
jgi:hypothetical protein